jgi:adenylosuccinate synthase
MFDIVLLSGPIGVGKSSFAEALARRVPIARASTRKWLIDRTGCENERRSLQEAGDEQDRDTGGRWVADLIDREAAALPAGHIILLDSIRIASQANEVRNRFGGRVFHVHLRASPEELERRYLRRDPELKEFPTYAEASAHGTEQQVGSLEAIADLVLETDHADPGTLAETALARRR